VSFFLELNLLQAAPRRLVLVAIALLAIGCERAKPAPAAAGDPVPARVVTLTPSATELVAAIAGHEVLVGVDTYSTFPAEIAGLPRVGDFLSPDQEAILLLHPTLVVADDAQAKVVVGLEAMGLRVEPPRMHTIADVQAAARRLGIVLGREAAGNALADGIEAALDGAGARHRGVRVLAVIDRERGGLGNMVAAGPGSYLDELLAIVGAENVLSSSGVRYPKISAEEILRAQPHIIIDVSRAADPTDPLRDWRSLGKVRAVATGQVVVVQDETFSSPGPRVAQALARLDEIFRAADSAMKTP
jgi:iron complex transport system substrate-binding protein